MRRLGSIPTLGCAALAIALIALPSSSAASTTRAQYIAQVDPICNDADRRIKRSLKGFIADLKQGAFPKAGRKYSRRSRVFKRSIRDVAAVAPPSEDVDLIDRWLDLQRRDARLPIAKALKRRNARRAVKLFDRSVRIKRRVDRLIGDYGFRDCN